MAVNKNYSYMIPLHCNLHGGNAAEMYSDRRVPYKATIHSIITKL
jgi:hypothetical protein